MRIRRLSSGSVLIQGQRKLRPHLSRRVAATIQTILGIAIVIVVLIGEPEIPTQGYSIELDFDSSRDSFSAVGTTREVFSEMFEFPGVTVNLTAQPSNDSFWFLTVSSQDPRALIIENSSGSFLMYFTRITLAGVRNWDFLEVQRTLYWFNVSSHQDDITVRLQNRKSHVYPALNLTSNVEQPSADIWAVATFFSLHSNSQIYFSGFDLVLKNETDIPTNLTGRFCLTINGFDLAYFGLSTSQITFPLQPGARIRWYNSPLSIEDANGVITAANGHQHEFQNGNLITTDAPRRVEIRVASLPYDYGHIVLRFDLDATKIRVSDMAGVTDVGRVSDNLITWDLWPGKWLNVVLIVFIVVSMPIVTWLHPE